jgi:hypothetical protein
LTDTPDIFFVSLAEGENAAYLSGVDDSALNKVSCSRLLNLEYRRGGSHLVQVYDGRSTGGFQLVLVEGSAAKGDYILSLWTFK